MYMTELLEIVGLVLFTSVKFLFAPSTIMALNYNFIETVVISIIGGWLGVFIFYYGGGAIFDWLNRFQKAGKKKFSRKNRLIIWLKNDFGLNGIAFVLGFASIPIVCLIAAKYFRSNARTIYYLLVSIVLWSFALTGISLWLVPLIKGAL